MSTRPSEGEAWLSSAIMVLARVAWAKYVSLSGNHYLAAFVLVSALVVWPFIYGRRIDKLVKFAGTMVPVDNPGGAAINLYSCDKHDALNRVTKQAGVMRLNRRQGTVDLVADGLALRWAPQASDLYSRVLAGVVANKRRSIFVSGSVWVTWYSACLLGGAPLAVYLLSSINFFYTFVVCMIVHLALQFLGYSVRQLQYARGENAVMAAGVTREELAEAYRKLASHGFGLDDPYGLLGIKSTMPCFRARAAQL